MPGTAMSARLLDPFNPIQALPKAAEFLSDSANSSAISALPQRPTTPARDRLRDWLAGSGPMPAQTRSYVLAITGRPVDDWPKETGRASDDQRWIAARWLRC